VLHINAFGASLSKLEAWASWPRPLLWDGSWAELGKISISLFCNFCSIYLIYKCGHGPQVGAPRFTDFGIKALKQ
jgi:hypothetical protein